MRIATVIILSACGFGTGCTTDDYMRIEGMTPGVGNAQSANTVMQMVDPWQPGVDNTNLGVPADRGDTAEAVAGQTTSDTGTTGSTSQ